MRPEAFGIVSLQKNTCCQEFNREAERSYERDCEINIYEVLKIKESIPDDKIFTVVIYC